MHTQTYLGRLLFVFLFTGCVIETPTQQVGPDAGEEPEGEPDAEPEPAPRGLLLQPRHGDIVEGSTAKESITVEGYASEPGLSIDIQVPGDPEDPSSWITITTVATESEPATGIPTAPAYRFQSAILPGASYWPQGALLRLRAVDEYGTTLSARYHDAAENCITGGCVRDSGEVILVSPASPPATPPYLARKGSIIADETLEYYAEIDAPATLTEFQTRYQFDPETDLTAAYYNAGDLGIGRSMSCTEFVEDNVTGVACYVGNHGEFGGLKTEAIEELVDGVPPFATVAMVYRPPAEAPNSVQFIVYGLDGSLLDEARLDSAGYNVAIPNNCLNCHGSEATYDPDTNAVTGARFLPFDPALFNFPNEPGLRQADQEPSLQDLNELILETEPGDGITEVVRGFYDEGLPAETSYVPSGWDNSAEAAHVYQEVIAATCRGCHVSRDDDLSFRTAAGFLSQADSIAESVCGVEHAMPNAEIPYRRFWSGRGRAYLAGFVGAGACAP